MRQCIHRATECERQAEVHWKTGVEQKQGKTASTQGLPTHVHTYTKAHIVFKIKVKKLLLMWLNFLTFKKKNFLTQRFSFNFLIFSPFHVFITRWSFILFASPKCQTGRPQEGTNPAAPDPENRPDPQGVQRAGETWVGGKEPDRPACAPWNPLGQRTRLCFQPAGSQLHPRKAWLWAALTSRNPQQIWNRDEGLLCSSCLL